MQSNVIGIRHIWFKRTHGIRYFTWQRFYFCCKIIEHWKDIPNVDNYQVSSLGNIYNKKYQRPRKINYDYHRKRNRRVEIKLKNNDNKIVNWSLSRLILMTFCPVDNHGDLQANHIDGNCYNNTLENLNWMTRTQNMQHAAKQGKFSQGVGVQITHQQTNQTFKFETI
eukprot:500533_1